MRLFQSSPARGGGCNAPSARLPCMNSAFQSSPARGGGCNWIDRAIWYAHEVFQSSPARGGRCNSSSQASCATVSRSFNPHPPVGAGATVRRPQRRARRLCFNPHPPVGAGATLRARSKPSRTSSFQSSPARGGGCNTVYDGYRFRSRLVSILTRPWGRVQPKQQVARAEAVGVSILTRPWGRVQLGVRIGARLASRRFNPHPPVGAGATQEVSLTTSPRVPFQSSPACGGGCNVVRRRESLMQRFVSILTRPWGRVQRGLENARERFPKRKCSSCQGVPCRALGG